MKYRKKPVVIDAWQFTFENKDMVFHNLREINNNIRPDGTLDSPKLIIPTLEGDMTESVGDYIIKGVNGELYPCKPDIFDKTYEPAEQDGDGK